MDILDLYYADLAKSTPENLNLTQAILWLRPASSQVLINKAEILGLDPLSFIYRAIDIVCDTAEKCEKAYT